MSSTVSDKTKTDFEHLLHCLKLTSIHPQRLHFDRMGLDIDPQTEVSITWNIALADDDPVSENVSFLRFRPRILVSISQSDKEFFKMESIIALLFEVTEQTGYEQAWSNQEVRTIFLEQQLQKTLWPFFRQEAIDGMTRLGLPGVPLPWLVI